MKKGYGYTYADGTAVPRYYDRICGGWIRLYGAALLGKKGNK